MFFNEEDIVSLTELHFTELVLTSDGNNTRFIRAKKKYKPEVHMWRVTAKSTLQSLLQVTVWYEFYSVKNVQSSF